VVHPLRALPGVIFLDPLPYTGDLRPEFASANGILVNTEGNVALTPPFREF
jgi:hypothetical protein